MLINFFKEICITQQNMYIPPPFFYIIIMYMYILLQQEFIILYKTYHFRYI